MLFPLSSFHIPSDTSYTEPGVGESTLNNCPIHYVLAYHVGRGRGLAKAERPLSTIFVSQLLSTKTETSSSQPSSISRLICFWKNLADGVLLGAGTGVWMADRPREGVCSQETVGSGVDFG